MKKGRFQGRGGGAGFSIYLLRAAASQHGKNWEILNLGRKIKS